VTFGIYYALIYDIFEFLVGIALKIQLKGHPVVAVVE